MRNYSDLKPQLVETLLEEFPQTEGDEVEAMVTHWFQSPYGEIPFLTESMRDQCKILFQKKPQNIFALFLF